MIDPKTIKVGDRVRNTVSGKVGTAHVDRLGKITVIFDWDDSPYWVLPNSLDRFDLLPRPEASDA